MNVYMYYNQLSKYLERNKLITESQFGFRKRSNTKLAVTFQLDNIRRASDNRMLTGTVFIDRRKAFDTVEHTILL